MQGGHQGRSLKQNGVKRLMVGSGGYCQASWFRWGAGDTRVKQHLWASQSEELLRALQSTAQQGQSMASARAAPLLIADRSRAVADAPMAARAGAGAIQAKEVARARLKIARRRGLTCIQVG